MNERTTLEIIAPTVEEAIAQGLAQLGLSADAVSVEVLDAGNKGLFGFGKHQVRVRLTVNASRVEPAQQQVSLPVSRPEALVESAKESESPSETDPLLDHTEVVISKLLHLLNLEAQVSAHYGERDREGRRNVHVDIRGNDLSILIGRRSETLNAFQYIASLIVGKEIQDWVQLVVDVEGYRDRREKQLIQMAQRMADQVAKSGRRQTLEPMPSAERRIIHIALRDHPDVITESTGEDPHRKVTIVPKNN
jgi:spoIIIJ-associated protein